MGDERETIACESTGEVDEERPEQMDQNTNLLCGSGTMTRELAPDEEYPIVRRVENMLAATPVGGGRHETARSPYVYGPLAEPTHIRLLHLLPGLRDSPLACTITDTDLDANPFYTALSYEWGTETELYPLICNEDRQFGIRRNLYDALLRIRSGDTALVLWIDAICINQADNAEKSNQIQMMTKIFNQADLTFMWLGECDEGIEKIMLSVCRIHHHFLSPDEGRWEPREGRCRHRNCTPELLEAPPTTEDWQLAEKLFDHSYFTRKWIFQEILIAREGAILCGSFALSWDCVDAFLSSFVKHTYKSKPSGNLNLRLIMGSLFLRLLMIDFLRNHNQSLGDTLHLLSLLRATRSLKATDPRDIIYSMLNISHNPGILTLRPDYRLSTEEVFIATARYLISFDITALFDAIGVDRSSQLPSWVPDWRDEAPGMINSMTALRKFTASGNPEVVSTPIMRRTAGETHLVLRAAQVATVRGVREMPHSAASRFMYGEVWDELTKLEAIFRDKKYPLTDETLDIAGIRTTLADTWKYGDWAPPEKFSMDKYQDTVRRAKSGNTSESDRLALEWMMKQVKLWSFFISDLVIGRCPPITRAGDEVYIIIGCRFPAILRPTGATKTFTLIGMCYAHGIMDGEWVNQGAKKIQNELKDKANMSPTEILRWLLLPDAINAWTEEITLI